MKGLIEKRRDFRKERVVGGRLRTPTSKPLRIPASMCIQSSKILYLRRSSSMRSAIRGDTTMRGSGSLVAGACSMPIIIADATSMEVGAVGAEGAGRCSSPVETVMFSVGCSESVATFC